MNIYQLFVRTFGNKNAETIFNGEKEQNGCGTFSDINDKALDALKVLGITHIWLTGVIRHSSMTSYPQYGIMSTNPLITKGKAGSPYSIIDYYDVDPDLAVNPNNRMKEFEDLVERIKDKGMKVIIDFVPNHLAREYKSLYKPFDVEEFGEYDDKNVTFSKDNNFYYCPGQEFVAPINNAVKNDSSEYVYKEFPAKASGNDVFSSCPTINDWYDTIKLNYGVDYQNGCKSFDTIPNTWYKMLNIMSYWCDKGIDGFRVDMAEMVPVEFWRWSLYMLRESYDVCAIAEIYQPDMYIDYIDAGFDYLYDKVGLYNTLENIFRHGQRAETLTNVWKKLCGLDDRMLRFMENHDEIRLSSKFFIGDALKSIPFVATAALMNRGPFMIYNGQESGENAENAVGYSGDDGRTSIFDYAVMPKHQVWMADGDFNGKYFSEEQHLIFDFYKKLLNLRLNNKAIKKGDFYDLMWVNPWYSNFDPQYIYAFLRFYDDERLLIVANFNMNEGRTCNVKIPVDALHMMNLEQDEICREAVDIFTNEIMTYTLQTIDTQGILINLNPADIKIIKL